MPVASRGEQQDYHRGMDFLCSSLIYIRAAIGYVLCSSAIKKTTSAIGRACGFLCTGAAGKTDSPV
jgi:hypothetical protein